MMKTTLGHTFEDIISIENLLAAWREFSIDKKNRQDVKEFRADLMDNIFELHNELKNYDYEHGDYESFRINDPKPRQIHKAWVRDRLLHHAIHRILYPFFDKKFIVDSFSCRLEKGAHKSLSRFLLFSCKVSKNHTRTAWVLKCDVRKFFENIDHDILIGILEKHISDKRITWLVQNVIRSFYSGPGRGLPLGNLTSQLLVNIYMNQLDMFIKHNLRVKYYIRYADDFLILSESRDYLEKLVKIISSFLSDVLKLEIHPNKIFIRTLSSGVDFLGWVHFSYWKILRTSTKRRMFKRLAQNQSLETKASYLGLLKHGDTHKLKLKLLG